MSDDTITKAPARRSRVVPSISIGKYCSAKGCKKVGRYAEKVSDWWVVRCEDHHGQRITLDLNKIPAQTDDPRMMQ